MRVIYNPYILLEVPVVSFFSGSSSWWLFFVHHPPPFICLSNYSFLIIIIIIIIIIICLFYLFSYFSATLKNRNHSICLIWLFVACFSPVLLLKSQHDYFSWASTGNFALFLLLLYFFTTTIEKDKREWEKVSVLVFFTPDCNFNKKPKNKEISSFMTDSLNPFIGVVISRSLHLPPTIHRPQQPQFH